MDNNDWIAELEQNALQPAQVYPGGLLILEDSFHIAYVNSKFGELFGCEPDDIVGQHLEDLFSPRDRKGALNFHNKLIRYESGFLDVVIVIRVSQTEYLSRMRMLKRQNLWIAIFENILAEDDDLFRQFHLGRERWTSIVRNSSEGIAMLDTEGRLIEFNSRFLEMMQFRSSHGVLLNEDAILHKNLFDLFEHPESNALRNAFETAKTKRKMKYIKDISYHQYVLKLELTLIHFPVQGFAGCSLVVKDITAQKQLEQAVAELNSYAHTVAHDLKNPLGAIIGYIEMIQSGSFTLPDEVNRDLNEGHRAALKAANIIDELLMLASVRDQQIEARPLDTASLVEDAQMRLTQVIDKAGAQVIVPNAWPDALGYGPWVEEIWTNYISNAVKYGGSPPLVELGAEERNGMVRFWVKDNGPGMTKEEQASLFIEFFRLAQHAEGEGHGLGLSIVQRIAEKLGGKVGVESQIGVGSTFYFTLPPAR